MNYIKLITVLCLCIVGSALYGAEKSTNKINSTTSIDGKLNMLAQTILKQNPELNAFFEQHQLRVEFSKYSFATISDRRFVTLFKNNVDIGHIYYDSLNVKNDTVLYIHSLEIDHKHRKNNYSRSLVKLIHAIALELNIKEVQFAYLRVSPWLRNYYKQFGAKDTNIDSTVMIWINPNHQSPAPWHRRLYTKIRSML